jgi:hypothetical protein
MEPQHSNAVVAWLASHFPHAIMVIYEQVCAWARQQMIWAAVRAVAGIGVYSLRVTVDFAAYWQHPKLLRPAANISSRRWVCFVWFGVCRSSHTMHLAARCAATLRAGDVR